MNNVTRRQFLKGTLAVGATAMLSPSRVLGASDDIRVAVIGFNGQGQGHINALSKMKGVRLVALCDVDPAVLSRTVDGLAKRDIKVEAYTDLRRVFDNKDIDAITTATPNHWHSLIGVWACQSGKDAYVEKPISHNVWEGRQLVKAARKYNRVVQGGTQARSSGKLIHALEWVREGHLGKVKVVTGTCFKARPSIGKTGKGEIPAGLDYNLWCGPAPMRPLTREKLHYDWHWVYDTGNGDMGNQGIHQMDIARWFLGVDHLSPRVMSIGGRLGYDDDGETPNTQIVYHDYPDAPLIFETRGLPKGKDYHDSKLWSGNMDVPNYPGARNVGVIVECEGGTLVVQGSGEGALALDSRKRKIRDFNDRGDGVGHIDNFIAAVRDRQPEKLNADCQETHLSSALCHTGLISHRLGKRMAPGEIRERIQSDSLASERFESMKDHLGRNGVDVSSSQVTLGPWLQFDPEKERFVKNDDANEMLSRDYRKGFEVPKKP